MMTFVFSRCLRGGFLETTTDEACARRLGSDFARAAAGCFIIDRVLMRDIVPVRLPLSREGALLRPSCAIFVSIKIVVRRLPLGRILGSD